MTQREAQFFVQGIQFAAAKYGTDDIASEEFARAVVDALNVNVIEMLTLTDDIHKSLDLGGFRGKEAQRRARK